MTHTTSESFHPMRGHVHDGATVQLRDMRVITIRESASGWRVVDCHGADMSPVSNGAYALLDNIVALDKA